jgi:hypothetical protein
MNRVLSLTSLTAVLVACSSSGSDAARSNDSPSPAPSSKSDTTPASDPPNASTESPCDTGVVETCSAWNERSTCVVVDGVRKWKKEACADGCYAGKCSPSACADECAPGEAGCKLWDMKSKAYVDVEPTTSLHDRARDYEARLRTTSLVHDQVVNVNYTDETRTSVAHYSGYRDAAIWTGSALAAEAWRLTTTRSPDAAARVDAMVRTLHRNFVVTGDPGYFARFVVPKASPAATVSPPPTCGSVDWNCDRTALGAKYDWVGGTSRDQYTGLILGFAMAYLATTDEELKAIIRQDVVSVAVELAKQRKKLPIDIIVNGGIKLTREIDIENIILAPSEMPNGRIVADLSTEETWQNQILGMREFLPDFSMLTKPAIGIGLPIPRASTSIMIGAIFEAAVKMSADSTDPKMVATHKDLLAYYEAHAQDWARIAKTWTFDTRDGCGQGYFSTHIAYIMGYVWSSFATDLALAPMVKDEIFDEAMWSAVQGHKNAYFAFLWGGTRGGAVTSASSPIGAANVQLAQFEPGPRIHAPRDTRTIASYMPHDTTCTNEPLVNIQTNAVDVKDRRVDDFIWQRQPWQLYDGGDVRRVFPGADYLAAYWVARRHGFLEDDRAGTCTRKGQ